MPAPDKRRYAAFISYSHTDTRWAAWLQRNIERYRVPKRLVGTDGAHGPVPQRPGQVFRDRDELAAGVALSDSVSEAMSASDSLLVICSPAASGSRWVGEEIRLFKKLHPDAPILCLVVDGDPAADDETAAFPLPLRFEEDSDGSPTGKRLEPLAADVRPGADGKNLARLKILAGLLGVPLDALRQREQQRKQRVMAGVTLASLAGMAFTGWLAWSAMLAREDAERRQGQAEELVEFILSDLQEGLLKVGRLDIMQSAAQEARSYFSGLDVRDLTVESLQGHAESLRQLGDLQLQQGEPEEALKAFEEAYRMDAELLNRAPEDADLLFNLGQSEFWVGYAYLNMADNSSALERFSGYMDVSRSLYERDPTNVDWVMELCYAYNNLASVQVEEGQTAEAVSNMEEALRYNLEALDLLPGDPDLLQELAISEGWLAEILQESGDLERAAVQRKSGQTRWQAVHDDSPTDADVRFELALVQMLHGDLLAAMGQAENARRELDLSIGHLEQLLGVDPDNVLWAQTLLNASTALHLQTQNPTSLTSHRSLLERFGEPLLSDPPTDILYRLMLARAFAATTAASANVMNQEMLGAEQEAALNLIGELGDELKGNASLLARRAEVLMLLRLEQQIANSAVPESDTPALKANQDKVLSQWAELEAEIAAMEETPQDPLVVARLVLFQWTEDPMQINEEVLASLWSTGYRHPMLVSKCDQLPSCP